LFDLTIAQNITYGLENVPMQAVIDAATKANIHQFIQQLPQVNQYKIALSNN
jgi:ABC-type multidrug transport system fused ATPase/permease subunit